METHNFPEVAKVQRFCLTLTGEAILWYESFKPIEVDQFRQQYLNFVMHKSSYSMYGDQFIMMRTWK